LTFLTKEVGPNGKKEGERGGKKQKRISSTPCKPEAGRHEYVQMYVFFGTRWDYRQRKGKEKDLST